MLCRAILGGARLASCILQPRSSLNIGRYLSLAGRRLYEVNMPPKKVKASSTVADGDKVETGKATRGRRSTQKKSYKESDSEESDEAPMKKSQTRGRKKSKKSDESSEDEEFSDDMPVKKTAGKRQRKSYKEDDSSENEFSDEAPPKKSAKRQRKTRKSDESFDDDDEDFDDAPAKKSAKRKPKKSKKSDESFDDEEMSDEAPVKKAGRRKSKPKKADQSFDNDDEELSDEAPPKKAAKSKPKKSKKSDESFDDEELSDEAPPKKSAKPKPKKSKKSDESFDDEELSDEAPPKKSAKPKPKKSKKADSASEDDEEEADSKPSAKKGRPAAGLAKKKTTPEEAEDAEDAGDDENAAAVDYEKKGSLKIVSWNVNGIRAWLPKGGLEYLEKESPDVFCIQETKCSDDKLPKELESVKGYKSYFLAGDKEGYSGVGILSKVEPLKVSYGIGVDKHDSEGRVITLEFDDFFLVNAYVPNAGRGLVRLDYRMQWDKDFRAYLCNLKETKGVILTGDLNVAHQEIDLANPKTNKKNAGFTQEERDGMTALLEQGFVDTFRKLYPDRTKAYTFWTYMMNARAKNVGWRLDYFIVSQKFVDNIVDNEIRDKVMGSDHCPIVLHVK